MGLFGKKPEQPTRQSTSSESTIDNNADARTNGDIIIICARLRDQLDIYLNIFENKSLNEVKEAFFVNPNLKKEILSYLDAYDKITSIASTLDSLKPYSYEDGKGFRYTKDGLAAKYPDIVYDSCRQEYVEYYHRFWAYLN